MVEKSFVLLKDVKAYKDQDHSDDQLTTQPLF